MQLLVVITGVLLCSCSSQLPVSFTKKSLNESIYVENHNNKYILHTGKPVDYITMVNDRGENLQSFKYPDSVTEYKIKPDRPLFTVYNGNDTLLVSNRSISFRKVVNLRDIGGLTTTEGKTVRWGRIFRSDNLSSLKNNEFEKFSSLGIKTVYDLRTASEIAPKKDNLPENISYIPFPIINDNGDLLSKMKGKVINGEVSEHQSNDMMLELYKSSVINNALLKELIKKIIYADEPLLYHCSAGKDRTGVVTALVLSILKVDRETIINEYMLSNFYRNKKIRHMMVKAKIATIVKPHLQTKVIENFMSVDRDYIKAAFEVIDTRYGGIDNFITNQLGISNKERSRIIAGLTF